MRSIVILALAALSVAACTYRTETVERQSPVTGRAIVTESSSIGTPTLVVRE
jgi:hypothetical protein